MKSKIESIGGIICQSSSIDQNTKLLSVFNVVDEVTVDIQRNDGVSQSAKNITQVINVPLNFQVISFWQRKEFSNQGVEVKARMEVEIVDPLEMNRKQVPFDVVFLPDKKKHRHFLNVQGISINTAGEYQFRFREILESGGKSDVLLTLRMDVILNSK